MKLQKLEFEHVSSKMDIVAILGVQKCYFDVSSSGLRDVLIKDHTHFPVKYKVITLPNNHYPFRCLLDFLAASP